MVFTARKFDQTNNLCYIQVIGTPQIAQKTQQANIAS